MTIAEWVGIAGLVLVLIGMAVSFNREITASESRSKAAIEEVVENQEEKYVEVKVCKIVHANSDKEYAELNKKIDKVVTSQEEMAKCIQKLLSKAGIA